MIPASARPLAPWAAKVILAIMIAAAALGVRWNHITAQPIDFHPARQYRGAQIARAYYVKSSSGMPEWKTRVASAYLREDPPIEAPTLEAVAASAYWLSRDERLWLPRFFASLFWLTGALFLYLLARRFVPWWGALVAIGMYLFLPFPLVASTSFQPDPLMTMLLIGAILAIVRHHELSTRRRFVAALALAAIAIFAKPVIAAFFLIPLFGALAIVRDGLRRAITQPSGYAFAALAVLPAAVLYVAGAITGSFLTGKVRGSIALHLWGESFYWRGWLDMLEDVLRAPALGGRSALLVLAVGLLAIPLSRSKTERAILLALWVGYAVLGLTYTSHVSSHDYYSLPLVPVVALSVAVAIAALAARADTMLSRRSVQVALVAAAIVVAAVGIGAKADSLGLPGPGPGYAQRVPEWELIGALVDHTPAALTLEGASGLKYHGWIGGRPWPNAGDLEWERANQGLEPISADERFRTTDERYYPAVGAMRPRPEYFIVTEPMELARQPDLVVLLSEFELLDQTPDHLVFDLRRRAEAEQVPPAPVAAATAGAMPRAFFYRLPPAWGAIERGMSPAEARRIAGRPRRVERRDDLRKPIERWLYGADEKRTLVFVDGRVFFAAMTY